LGSVVAIERSVVGGRHADVRGDADDLDRHAVEADVRADNVRIGAQLRSP
jgi:hypothetical protein